MGNPFATAGFKHLEHDVQSIWGFIALDGSSDVVGQAPTATTPLVQAYSMCKGLMKSVGIAGAVVTQPHTGTGVYAFTLDEPWNALLGWSVQLLDPGAVALPVASCTANVRGNITGLRNTVDPGTDPTIAAQTVQIRFRTAATGALINPTASKGFWLSLILKRTAVY